jgi:hypothetical protein
VSQRSTAGDSLSAADTAEREQVDAAARVVHRQAISSSVSPRPSIKLVFVSPSGRIHFA